MEDTNGAEQTAVATSDALAALEQDKLVDLTASMKLATGSLNPPQTASSLTLSDDGSTGQAKVRSGHCQNCAPPPPRPASCALLELLYSACQPTLLPIWLDNCDSCLANGLDCCRCSQTLSGHSTTSAQDPSQLHP